MSVARVLHNDTIGTPEERALARKLADAFLARLPKSVLREDIHQAALIGLWDGLRRCSPVCTPEQRKGYLITRIRGQIIDELRAQDWLPRRARQSQDPDAPTVRIVRFDDIGASEQRPWEERLPAEGASPEERLVRQAEVDEALDAPLNRRHRHILRAHYWKGSRFADIAGELGVSEPRVSQQHAQAIHTMRAWRSGELPEWTPPWKCKGTEIGRDARAAILKKHEENNEHQSVDRGAGGATGAPARPGAFAVAVPVRWLGGPPAAPARRSVSRRAGGAELGGEALPRVRDARPAAVSVGAATVGDGGLPVSAAPAMATADPVPSVLPEEGFALPAELIRYRDWMVDQALVQSGGNRSEAARRLGINRTTLVMLLGNASARVKIPAMKHSESEPAPAPPDAKLAALVERIPWDEVARLRSEGRSDARIIHLLDLPGKLGAHKYTIEKALRQPRPLAKCGT